jgi:hypothetical protein
MTMKSATRGGNRGRKWEKEEGRKGRGKDREDVVNTNGGKGEDDWSIMGMDLWQIMC